jgi:hypothetical protein
MHLINDYKLNAHWIHSHGFKQASLILFPLFIFTLQMEIPNSLVQFTAQTSLQYKLNS